MSTATQEAFAIVVMVLSMVIVGLFVVVKQRPRGKSHEQLEVDQEADVLKLIDSITGSNPPPLTPEAYAEQARTYARVKSSKRVRVTRTWAFDTEHVEVTEGEPLAFGVDPDGGGWVTIKKDDGHITHVMHSLPQGRTSAGGMVVIEARFV